MIIAVTYENGNVFGHFGHTEQFKLYTVEDGKIVKTEVVDTNGSGHGALAGFLAQHKVSKLICGGIGMGARMALDDEDIELYPGASGNADEAVEKLLANKLEYNPETTCNHHHDHEHGHDCGHHHEHGHDCSHHHHDHEHGHDCSHGNCNHNH